MMSVAVDVADVDAVAAAFDLNSHAVVVVDEGVSDVGAGGVGGSCLILTLPPLSLLLNAVF